MANVFIESIKAAKDVFKEHLSDNMVTTSTTRNNKTYYKYEDNIFLSKLHVEMMLDKLSLYKENIIFFIEVRTMCNDYIINNDINLDFSERREQISCVVELNDVSCDKIKLLLKHKNFLNIQIFLDPNGEKELLDISSINQSTNYELLYIGIFDVIDCYNSATKIYDIYTNELNYTLQNIYKYNNSIEEINSYSLEILNENSNIAYNNLDSVWEKTRFYNELYDLVDSEIEDRINQFSNDNIEKAFTSDKKISFELFLIKDIDFLNKYVKKIQATHSINKNKNTVTIKIPIRKLRDVLDLINASGDDIAQEVINLLEPIGMDINK